jgi:hypothetical protein
VETRYPDTYIRLARLFRLIKSVICWTNTMLKNEIQNLVDTLDTTELLLKSPVLRASYRRVIESLNADLKGRIDCGFAPPE